MVHFGFAIGLWLDQEWYESMGLAEQDWILLYYLDIIGAVETIPTWKNWLEGFNEESTKIIIIVIDC